MLTAITFRQVLPAVVSNSRQWWRIKITVANATGANITVYEMAMAGSSGGANLATGGTAFASTQFNSSFAAQYAFDNNMATRWAALGSSALPYILGYKLPSAATINQLVITSANQSGGADAPNTFILQSSADSTTGLDGTWDDEWTVSGQTGWPIQGARTFNRP